MSWLAIANLCQSESVFVLPNTYEVDSFSWMYDPVILPVPGDSFIADDHQVDVRCEIVNTITHSSRELT